MLLLCECSCTFDISYTCVYFSENLHSVHVLDVFRISSGSIVSFGRVCSCRASWRCPNASIPTASSTIGRVRRCQSRSATLLTRMSSSTSTAPILFASTLPMPRPLDRSCFVSHTQTHTRTRTHTNTHMTHTHTHTHTRTHAHTYVFIFICILVYVSPFGQVLLYNTHTHTHTHTHTDTHTQTRTHTCTHTRTHIHTNVFIFICILAHASPFGHVLLYDTHTHKHMHTHTHAYTFIFICILVYASPFGHVFYSMRVYFYVCVLTSCIHTHTHT